MLETDPEPPSTAVRRANSAKEVSGQHPELAPATSQRVTRSRDVDHDLDAICLKALRKRPEDRYVTAGDLAADLRR